MVCAGIFSGISEEKTEERSKLEGEREVGIVSNDIRLLLQLQKATGSG